MWLPRFFRRMRTIERIAKIWSHLGEPSFGNSLDNQSAVEKVYGPGHALPGSHPEDAETPTSALDYLRDGSSNLRRETVAGSCSDSSDSVRRVPETVMWCTRVFAVSAPVGLLPGGGSWVIAGFCDGRSKRGVVKVKPSLW